MLVGRKMKLSEYLKDAVPAALAAAAGDPAKIAEVEARVRDVRKQVEGQAGDPEVVAVVEEAPSAKADDMGKVVALLEAIAAKLGVSKPEGYGYNYPAPANAAPEDKTTTMPPVQAVEPKAADVLPAAAAIDPTTVDATKADPKAAPKPDPAEHPWPLDLGKKR